MATSMKAAPAVNGWRVERGADGVVIVRGGDVPVPGDETWRKRLVQPLRSTWGVRVAGARRVQPDGAVFSMGEFVVHPKGFHSVGRGAEEQAYRFPEEVDAISSGLVAIDAEAFDRAEGDRLLADPAIEPSLRLLELCLVMRRDGGRVLCVPDAAVPDESEPDTGAEQRKAFKERWGFDWLAADLDDVRQRHQGTGLLWHPRYQAAAMAFEKYDRRVAVHWQNYEQVGTYRQRADHLAKLVRQLTPRGRVLDLGCGDGLFSHLFAMQGLEVIGLDNEPSAIEQARAEVGRREYTGTRPAFRHAQAEALPFGDASFQTVVMLDVIEHLPNPVAVLRECRRVLGEGGHLLVTTPQWQYGTWSDPCYHVTEYREAELVRQVEVATDCRVITTGRIGGVYRDVVVAVQA